MAYICRKIRFMQKTILVIEDDKDIQEILTYVLEAEDYNVICAEDDTIFDNISTIKPSLILMDNQLQGASGTDMCYRIKNNVDTSEIPVIILSANTNIEILAQEGHADGFLAKPFDVNEVVRIVAKYSL